MRAVVQGCSRPRASEQNGWLTEWGVLGARAVKPELRAGVFGGGWSGDGEAEVHFAVSQ
ncbi:MAG: hypothetical protein RLZZ536_2842, partial [Planctomycetota bacterium]